MESDVPVFKCSQCNTMTGPAKTIVHQPGDKPAGLPPPPSDWRPSTPWAEYFLPDGWTNDVDGFIICPSCSNPTTDDDRRSS